MNYDLWGYINTGGLQMPSIKTEVSREAVFRVLANLVWHCNEQDQNKVWVGLIKQASETKLGRSTCLLARRSLSQAGWLIDTGEKEIFGAWVYRLEIPGFDKWLSSTNSQTTNSQADISEPGLGIGLGNALGTGLGIGLGNALGTGLGNGLNSQSKTELNETKLNPTQPDFEQVLIRLCKKIELDIFPSQVPFDKICNSKATQRDYLPKVQQALKMFGNKSASDRDCAVYVLSKVHPDNDNFKCSHSTYQTLDERYSRPKTKQINLIEGQKLLGDEVENIFNNIENQTE